MSLYVSAVVDSSQDVSFMSSCVSWDWLHFSVTLPTMSSRRMNSAGGYIFTTMLIYNCIGGDYWIGAGCLSS